MIDPVYPGQVELFSKLQLLNNDYLRQRGLYSIQDITSRLLTEVSYLILINFINVRICPRQEAREAIVQSNECTL